MAEHLLRGDKDAHGGFLEGLDMKDLQRKR